jgi:hypothetical protein
VERAQSWTATTPTLAVKKGYFTLPPGNPGRSYDISPDGRRFLMIKEGENQAATGPSLIVVEHWTEELKKLAK